MNTELTEEDIAYMDIANNQSEFFDHLMMESDKLNNLINSGYFSEEADGEEGTALLNLSNRFKKEDLAREYKRFKAHRVIYSIMSNLEKNGFISIHKPVKGKDFRSEALTLYNNYKKRLNNE